MPARPCQHPDVRKFDGLRCCLACGEAVFDAPAPHVTSDPTAAPAPYEYATLNYRLGQEVRLCVLLPGDPEDPLQCEIIHVNLEDRPDYEAVSYTWASDNGDASLSRRMQCSDDRYFSITANCDAVLRQLRRRGLRRRLWIDAVSIDQNNVNERNHQVGLMDHVYSQARSVRICIQNHHIQEEWTDYGKMFRMLQSGSAQDIQANREWLFCSLMFLTSLRYFRRGWVIQEVALATSAYLLLNSNELLLTWSVLDRLESLTHQRNYQLPGVLRLRWKADQMPLADIAACLRAGLDSECTDPRDKLYAILSFIKPQLRSLIPVNYSLEVDAVYASAAIAIISSRRNLEILSYVGWNKAAWASDWRTSPALTIDKFKDFLGHEDAMDHARYNIQLSLPSATSTRLAISQFEGEKIGPWQANVDVCTVDEMDMLPSEVPKDASTPVVFCRMPHHANNILPRLQVRAHFIDRISEKHASILVLRESSGLRTCLYMLGFPEAISINQACIQIPGYAWLLPCFQKDRPDQEHSNLVQPPDSADDPQLDVADLRAFIETAEKQGAKKITFLTANSVGFARPGFEPGYEIWALDGARAPLILRGVGSKTYRVVSDCYVWAALELDFWNPGTKKGRWRQEGTLAEDEQTHIIEIF